MMHTTKTHVQLLQSAHRAMAGNVFKLLFVAGSVGSQRGAWEPLAAPKPRTGGIQY